MMVTVQITITTSKTGISDIERLHKTEKLRIINCESDLENKLTKFETILFTHNHKSKDNTSEHQLISLYMLEPRI